MVEETPHGFPIIIRNHPPNIRPLNPLFKPQPISLKELNLRRVPLTGPKSKPYKRIRILYKLAHHRYYKIDPQRVRERYPIVI